MLGRSLVVVLAVSALAPGVARAGGAFVPPLSIEVGGASVSTPERAVPAAQVLVGVSWASLDPHPTPVDVSVGLVVTSELDETSPPAAARAVAPRPSIDATGGFLGVGVRLDHGRHWRTFAGVRGELLDQDGVGVLGGAAHVSAELWHPVATSGPGGGILGTVALAAWAEVGARERPQGGAAAIVAAGLGVRLPLVIATR